MMADVTILTTEITCKYILGMHSPQTRRSRSFCTFVNLPRLVCDHICDHISDSLSYFHSNSHLLIILIPADGGECLYTHAK